MRVLILSLFLLSTAQASAANSPFAVGTDQILRVVSNEEIDVPFYFIELTKKINVRGLMITAPNPYPPFTDTFFPTANRLCDKLRYQGISHWRLPSLREMIALNRLGLWDLPGYAIDEYFWVALLTQNEYDEEYSIGERLVAERCENADQPQFCRGVGIGMLKTSLDDEVGIYRTVNLVNAEIQKFLPTSKTKAKFFCVK